MLQQQGTWPLDKIRALEFNKNITVKGSPQLKPAFAEGPSVEIQ